MAITLNIMRTTPITQKEFVSIVKNDSELSFLTDNVNEASGGDFILRHYGDGNIEIVLGPGNFQHPAEGTYAVELGPTKNEENIIKLIAIAERLNARLWQDVGCSFYGISNGVIERYKDDQYYASAVLNNSQENWISPERAVIFSHQERRGRIIAFGFFFIILGYVLYLWGFLGGILLIVPIFFLAGVLGAVFARNIDKMFLTITYFSFLLFGVIIILYGLYLLFKMIIL